MNSLLSANELSNMTATSSVSMSGLSVTSTQFQDQDDKTACEHRLCLIGQDTANNLQLLQALKTLGLPILTSETGMENVMDPEGVETLFIMTEFEGSVFDNLRRNGCRILGPPVIYKCAAENKPPPITGRPLYCPHMAQLVVCFTGFLEGDEVKRLAELVHHMGGGVRKDFTAKVTHLVANATSSYKYRGAVSLGTPIMTKEWVHSSWQNRHSTELTATSETMLQYKMAPFYRCVLAFLGFSEEEKKLMEVITQTQGGTFADIGDQSCTHLVIEENSVTELPNSITHTMKLVKQEWFWACVKIDACADECLFKYVRITNTPEEALNTPGNTPVIRGSRKRRRLKEKLAVLSQENDDMASPRMPCKRRSSTMNDAVLSMSTSMLLDATPDEPLASNDLGSPMQIDSTPVIRNTPTQPISKRHMTAMELLQTETNYVRILQTIITIFKDPLETEQTGGPILDQEEIKTIFSKIPEIYEVHRRLLEDVETLLEDYNDEKSIAQIILKHSKDMTKAYPPFVNFFELSKQTINDCEKQKPRFHAFLKICHSKPECCRQTLTDLLIRPVQRLPSMILLLSDLLKRTTDGHAEHEQLTQAVDSLRKVTEHINEDKRKTEGHTQMFEVMNDIEDVPPHLLSAHRSFIMRADMTEIGDKENGKGENFSEKGGSISMFLFSDTLEICKRRGKPVSSFKSPHSNKIPTQKFYKHIELVPLSHIRRILDVQETEECKNTFAILCKPPMDTTDRLDRLYLFTLIREEPSKEAWLKTLCKHMADVTCKTDADNFLTKISPDELEITKSDFDKGKLNKAMRRARRATRKVGRTFSFNKTPRRTLQRAASTATLNMSPMVTSTDKPHPAEHMDLTGARLASTSSLQVKTTSPLATRPPCTPSKLKSVTYGSSSASWL
ncbi:protein ECT2-like [Asterias amurensis]|uniref:protein ECT2-like n=1 Tax=Asterias amurensis TaxID=7602 RepID=UPI003AB40DF3